MTSSWCSGFEQHFSQWWRTEYSYSCSEETIFLRKYFMISTCGEGKMAVFHNMANWIQTWFDSYVYCGQDHIPATLSDEHVARGLTINTIPDCWLDRNFIKCWGGGGGYGGGGTPYVEFFMYIMMLTLNCAFPSCNSFMTMGHFQGNGSFVFFWFKWLDFSEHLLVLSNLYVFIQWNLSCACGY